MRLQLVALSLLASLAAEQVLAQRRKLLCGDEICSVTGSPDFNGTGWQSNGKKFCLNNKPLDRVTLGHVSWTFLHTTAAYLPVVLNSTTKPAFTNLIWSVRDIYACELCRGHFQELMTDPVVVSELEEVQTRVDAVLFLWKVHNMVTTAQYPDTPLYFPGVGMSKYIAKQPQTYTIQTGQRVYAHGSASTDELHAMFVINGTSELHLSELEPEFKAQLYDNVLARWRVEGGSIPVPSQYAAQPMTLVEKLEWDETLQPVLALPPVNASVCDASIARTKKLTQPQWNRTCSQFGASTGGGKIDVTAYTMGRCPYCALTMESLRPFATGALGDKFSFHDRYVLMENDANPLTVNDFTSLHGPGETVADAYELCAQQYYPNSSQWLPFVWCIDKEYYAAGTNALTERCARGADMDFLKLKTCAWGPEGVRLLKGSVKGTTYYGIDSAPTIVIGGKVAETGVLEPQDWDVVLCQALACQESADQFATPDNAATYMTSLDTPEQAEFATDTSLYSDQGRLTYKLMLQNALADGEVSPAEQMLLKSARGSLGITELDHRAVSTELATPATVGGITAVSATSESQSTSTHYILPAVLIVGAIVAAVFGTWRVVRSRRSKAEEGHQILEMAHPTYGQAC